MSRCGELAALVREQWADMSRDEQRAASPEYRRAVRSLGVKPGRSRRVSDRTATPDSTGIDPIIQQLIDSSGLRPALARAVEAVAAGSGLRPAAAIAGVSYQTVSNVARRVLGVSPFALVARLAADRLLAIRDRVRRLSNTEGVRVSVSALLS